MEKMDFAHFNARMQPGAIRPEQYLVSTSFFKPFDDVIKAAHTRGISVDIRIVHKLLHDSCLGTPVVCKTPKVWNDEIDAGKLRSQHVNDVCLTNDICQERDSK